MVAILTNHVIGRHRARNIKVIFVSFIAVTTSDLHIIPVEKTFNFRSHLPDKNNIVILLLINTLTKNVGGEKNSRCHRLVTKRSLRRCQCECFYIGFCVE